jgi:hypothetical protein
MVTRRVWTTVTMIGSLLTLTASCGSGGGGGGSGGGGGGSASSGGSGQLKWYITCGDPVCPSTDMPHMPVCTTEKEGDPCAEADKRCGLQDACGADLLCTSSDPKNNCPISLASYKHDIRYLPDVDLKRVHDEIIATPLATWRYNHEGASGREHLGFIIDDNPRSPAVAERGDRVDLYGYTSMAVAAIQVQQKQIRALEQEMKSLREELLAARRDCGDRRAQVRSSEP